MPVHVRFIAGDDPAELALGLRALGLPGPAALLVGSALLSGHALASGVPAEAAAAVAALCAKGGARATTGDRADVLLLSGRLEQLRRLGEALLQRHDAPGASDLGGRLLRACFLAGREEPVRIGGLVAGGGRTLVMGVVNVTPDSFSDGGRFATPGAAIARGRALREAGADVLDVGGESTRPRGLYGEGSRPVAPDEELARVLPVVEALGRELPGVALSVDTSKPEVARAALAAGAAMVNDVTGLARPEMIDVVARAGAACCVMHMPGDPSTMAERTSYEDLVAEVAEVLVERCERAEAGGVSRERLLVDPGFGFGKTFEQNLFLLRQLRQLRASVGRPVVVGTSRKGFLGHVTGRPIGERDAATAASVAVAILRGAAVVRVHDVASCRDAVQVADAVAGARDGGALF